MSTYCVWMMLNDSHMIAARCGAPLDATSEQRYRALRQATEEAFVDNASRHAGATAQTVREQMDRYVQSSQTMLDQQTDYCAKPDAPAVINMLKTITSPENTNKILESLKAPRDPYDGDCL